MNTIFALIAIIGGAAVSLVGWRVVAIDKFLAPGEANLWHERYDKIIKVIGPTAAILGLLLIVF